MKNSMPRTETHTPGDGATILITGCSGFVGRHLCRALLVGNVRRRICGLDMVPMTEPGLEFFLGDIRRPDDLQRVADRIRPDIVLHLAAEAEVVTPFDRYNGLLNTNVQGTLNVLQVFGPRLLVFASSSAVYGTSRSVVQPTWSRVRPVGIYGLSKAAGELITRDWVCKTGNIAINLRFGNVVGSKCRGLIPYLVDHARKHPGGSPSVQLRGQGRLIRDYVPVAYTVQVIRAAMGRPWRSGLWTAFNVGTGVGTSNAAVAAMVQRLLRRRGYKLDLDFDHPLALGEAEEIVLDMKSTVKHLGLRGPGPKPVRRAIEEAVLSYLAP